MADIYTTLKTRTNQDNVYPNIKLSNIPDGEITGAKLKNGAVDTAQIATEAISHEKLEFNSVDDDNIVDGSITNSKLSDGAVTGAKIADETIGNDKLIDEAISGSKLRPISVTAEKVWVNELTIDDIYTGLCGGDFIKFTHAMSYVMTLPTIKIAKRYESGGVYYCVPVYLEVAIGDMVTFHIKDYGAVTWTTIAFEDGDPLPSGLEDIVVNEVYGALRDLLH